MLTFLYFLAIVAVAATAVTVYAYLTAEEGYEDALGFHAVTASESDESDMTSSSKSNSRDIPPFAAVR